MGFDWKKLLYYAGFSDGYDEQSDGYDDYDQGVDVLSDWDSEGADTRQSVYSPNVRPMSPSRAQTEGRQSPAHVPPTGTVNVIESAANRAPAEQAQPSVVDDVRVVSPEVYEDLEEIGSYLRKRIPVVVNMQGTDIKVSKRALDFLSGATFVLDARMSSDVKRVFLVLPKGVKLSNEARTRLRDRGLIS